MNRSRSGCGLVPPEVPIPAKGGLPRGGMLNPAPWGPGTGSGCRVCGQVALEQRAVGEDLAAGGAGRALRPVRAHVHVERALLREALGADRALEGTHACVRDHVLQQVVAQRERSPAHGALVGLLPYGRQGMSAGKGLSPLLPESPSPVKDTPSRDHPSPPSPPPPTFQLNRDPPPR